MRSRAPLLGILRVALVAGALLALAGCEPQGPVTSPKPQARPEPAAAPVQVAAPRSVRSAELARYYAGVQNDLLTGGLLRTDGGGPDTPFTDEDLARNFETLAFFDEYARGPGRSISGGRLSRWQGPVRIGVEFGPSVPPGIRSRDAASISGYANRLARVTGHSIATVESGANFHVFVASDDDAEFLQTRLVELVPSISQAELALFRDLPRSFYCLVVAVAGTGAPNEYTRAVALIRAEHPDLVRLSCIHEEIAQGLGLPNDSPAARPSIFNDDDEFALLTGHDEMLLRILYDPRLQPGMTADEARPTIQAIARELAGASS